MPYRALMLLILLSLSINALAMEKLIFAIDVIRHGDRTPVAPLPKVKFAWPEGAGQLTAEGMQQEYKLGEFFRKKYIGQSGLLPPTYQAETIYVRSSDMDRTLMSAQSVLFGLYPLGAGPTLSGVKQFALPKGLQPIPVHTVAQNNDELFFPKQYESERKVLLEKYIFSRADWQAKEALLKPHFARWSNGTGVLIYKLIDLGPIADALYVGKLHHAALPEGLSQQDVEQIIEAGRWSAVISHQDKKMAQLRSLPLLRAIAGYLTEAQAGKTQLRYVLFSGHDTTLMSLLSSLNVVQDEVPPYAANLNFALYQLDDSGYQVRVSYNNQPVLLPSCNSSCSLEQFLKLTGFAG